MARTRRNVPGWTTSKQPDHDLINVEKVVRDYNRGHPGKGEIKDNPKYRGTEWKGPKISFCARREAKRMLKAKRNRADRRYVKFD